MTTLSEQTLPRPPRPSVPARLEQVVYAWERLSDILPEVAPVLRSHWQEVQWFKEMPLDPDWEKGLAYEQAGVLFILTARKDGRLVGYIFSYILESLFFSMPWATVQGFWLDPLYRGGWTGVRLFKECEKGLRERGAKAISVEILLKIAKDRGTIGRILERLGYTHLGNLFAKVL